VDSQAILVDALSSIAGMIHHSRRLELPANDSKALRALKHATTRTKEHGTSRHSLWPPLAGQPCLCPTSSKPCSALPSGLLEHLGAREALRQALGPWCQQHDVVAGGRLTGSATSLRGYLDAHCLAAAAQLTEPAGAHTPRGDSMTGNSFLSLVVYRCSGHDAQDHPVHAI
jgi:hypothetical protein